MSNIAVKSSFGRSALVCCCLGLFLSTLDTGIINLALATLSDNFNVSLEHIGLTVTLYLIFLIVFLIPAGWLGDYFGQKIALIIGFLIFGATSLTAGLSDSATQLIISRCGQGISAALLQANCLGLAGQQPDEEKAKMNSAIMLAISLGPILGPSIGGLLMQWGGWQLLFLINIPLCAIGLFFSFRINSCRNVIKTRFDFIGFFLFIAILAGMAMTLYGLDFGLSSEQMLCVVIASFILLILFLQYESRVAVPFFSVTLLKEYSIKYIVIGSALFGITAGVIFSASPILFIRHAEFNLQSVGLICTASPIGVVFSVFIRRALKIKNSKIIMIYSLPLMLISFFLLFLYDENISIYKYIIAALCYGIGGGLFQSSLLNIAMHQHKDRQSTIGALLRLFQNGGIIIGTAYTLSILETTSGFSRSSPKLWMIVLLLLIMMQIYSYFYFHIKGRP